MYILISPHGSDKGHIYGVKTTSPTDSNRTSKTNKWFLKILYYGIIDINPYEGFTWKK